jgi:hypothetical protein
MIHICPVCDYETKYTTSLRRHIDRKHPENHCPINKEYMDASTQYDCPQELINPLQCQKCEKIFKKVYNVKVHLNCCKGKKDPLKCEYCSAAFAYRTGKYYHYNICKEKIRLEREQQEQLQPIINNNTPNNIEQV